ncbi:beta-L-arabinofuranosidase domain-containing protein [Gracilibacillus sp. YIM 98692]|uniref:beta-L-arabinofuranosidase domain-containing protein n=1 Tax=Gracilibacillus sp. YIM 98692 TaxID=2663532 RepID=UPI00320463DE
MAKLQHTKLLDGKFKISQEKGKEYLLFLNIDRLLAPCYEAVSQPPKNKRYGGWESKPIAGHSIGHWLSAAATMYHVTKDIKLYEKIRYALEEMTYIQSFDKDGYISGFPRDCFDQVFAGDFKVGNFELGGSWVPWYSIHKIFAGLIDVYKFTGEKQAIDIVTKLADWAYDGLAPLSEEQFQKMLICEHGGMNEAFADLYLITDDERYLELAEKFFHKDVLNPLAKEEDDLEGKHANTQIPKVIGVAKLYNITGKEIYKRIASYFWEQVVQYRTYAIGGNSNREHFGPKNEEKLGVQTTETCNTYNMLKLTDYLFQWTKQARYYDFYERALFNHILASQDPDSGMKTYFVSSEPGHFKVYHSREESFWCCTGTGMENPARYNRSIFHQEEETLYINLFISAQFKSVHPMMTITQRTDFPFENQTTITIDEVPEQPFTIYLRQPNWLKVDSELFLNGEKINYQLENGYVKLVKKWKENDQLTMSLPLSLDRYIAKDDENKQAIMYGPIVLAGALGRENFPETDILSDHLALDHYPLIDVPALVTDQPFENWIEIVDKQQLIFETKPIGQPGNQSIKLKPFFNIHHERYTIYWSVMNHQEYQYYQEHEQNQKLWEQQITVDIVTPNEQQPEVEHGVSVKNSTSGYSNLVHSGWRDARDDGYFSYNMNVDPSKNMYLHVTYYGSDDTIEVQGKMMERNFSIWIDDEMLAEQSLISNQPGKLFSVNYPIPYEMVKDKNKVKVTFYADKRKIAGGVYQVQMLNA